MVDPRRRLAADGLSAFEWSNGPGDRYGAHRHDYDKVVVTTDGSITFHMPELNTDVELATGERLELPAGTLHGATVGREGVTCLEGHLPAGNLERRPRHLSRDR